MSKYYIPSKILASDEALLSFILENHHIENLCKKIVNNGDIICLFGQYGAGKDLWTRLLMVYSKHYFGAETHTHLRFAEDLRADFKTFGINEKDLDWLKRRDVKFEDGTLIGSYDVSGMTARDAMIFIAENNKVKFGEDYYAKKLCAKLESVIAENKKVIISDCRFDIENELLVKTAQQFNKLILRYNIPADLPQLEVILSF